MRSKLKLIPFLFLAEGPSAAWTLTSPTKSSTESTTAHARSRASRANLDSVAHFRAKVAHSIAKGERRAKARGARSREACAECQRPPSLCLCHVLPQPKYSTSTKLIVLQHPNERRKKNLSTVPLLRLVLEDVQVFGGYAFDPEDLPPVQDMLLRREGRKPLLLYPGDDAISLDCFDDMENRETGFRCNTKIKVEECNNGERDNDAENDDIMLIVIDGTWNEAKRIARDSPLLVQECQSVQFSSPDASLYDAIRQEPEEHCLSTLEACAQALALLEPPSTAQTTKEINDKLLSVLQAHVDAHLTNAYLNDPRHQMATAKAYAKNRRRREIERQVFADSTTNGQNHEHQMENNTNTQTTQTISSAPRTLSDGAVLRPLKVSDADMVDSWWEYRSAKSLSLARRRIEIDQQQHEGTCSGCFGIEADGELVACIMRYEGGSLGMMYVQESHRRRGYALALLQHATKTLQTQGEERVAFVVDGNAASEAVFEAAGWVEANPDLKRQTGKRRAKRKWIHKDT